jgi:CAI-1 autoinducer synthase
VDESHSIGVYGERGEGLVRQLGLTDRVHYLTLSLSKAYATRAGLVAGPARVMSYFPYEARPAIFSSAVLLHEIAGLNATLTVSQDERWRRERLWENTRYLRQGLSRLGYSIDQDGSQIVALQSGTELQTRQLRDALEERGVFGAVFCWPATPKNRCVIRLSVNARLGKAELDRVIGACAEIASARSITPWPKDLMVGPAPIAASDKGGWDWAGFGAPVPAAGS